MRLWRYMDFTKFVALISSANLFFCRADLFRDPFEGSYSKVSLSMRPEIYKDIPGTESVLRQLSDFYKQVRGFTFINCWHANEYESAAMWDLYAKTNEAVAIETTYDKLQNILPDEAFLGCVKYIDYETDWLPEGNSFNPFMHKRKSFEHEREVRSVIQEIKGDNTDAQPSGISVPIVLDEMISSIHVSPTAPDWFADLVTEVSAKYDLTIGVKRSDLYSDPVF
jgi:hypothetical protein